MTTSDDIGIYKNAESHREDLTNQVFGELTVLCLDVEKTKNTDNYHSYWVCRCSYGNIIYPNSNQLKSGHTKTCGDRSIHYTGENNPSWKGGVTSESDQIRQSRYYKDYREAVLKKDNYDTNFNNWPPKIENLNEISSYARENVSDMVEIGMISFRVVSYEDSWRTISAYVEPKKQLTREWIASWFGDLHYILNDDVSVIHEELYSDGKGTGNTIETWVEW